LNNIGFLFPGQGAQSVGMGRELARGLDAARRVFERANEVLGYDLAKICFEGPDELLNATENCQPGLFVTSMAALEKLKQDSPEVVDACRITAGLSLGEYSALCFAGVMSFEDALRVVRRRGQAMQAAADANPSGMVSVLGMDADKVQELCDQVCGDGEVLQIANLLCPGNIACSGHNTACIKLTRLAVEAGAMKVVPLTVAGAFHTPLMQPAVEELAEALNDIQMVAPRIPVVSNVDAKVHMDPEQIRDLLIKQIVTPVWWEKSIGVMIESGANGFYEIGAGKVLRALMKRISRKMPLMNV